MKPTLRLNTERKRTAYALVLKEVLLAPLEQVQATFLVIM